VDTADRVKTPEPAVPQQRLRILIVENHEVVGEALSALLNDQPDMVVVGHAESVAACAAKGAELVSDIAIVDFHLADGTGPEASARIREFSPDLKLIFLSRDDGPVARLAALEAGASGYLRKSAATTEIVDAIRRVARGDSLFTTEEIASLLEVSRQSKSHVDHLTPREKQVLILMAQGAPTRAIAIQLGISYTTARTHIRSLEHKLEVHDKLSAVVRARELGLTE